MKRYLRSVQGQEVLKLLFRLRIDSAGLLEDKKRCNMIIDERCVMYESGAGEDVGHLLVMCGKFEKDWWVLVDEVSRIVGAGVWLEEYERVC